MHLMQNALIKYIVKNGNQQKIKPPTMMASVLAAFVSIRNRLACTFNSRFAVLRFERPLSRFGLFSVVLSSPALELFNRNVSIVSFRFCVINIMCNIGLLCTNGLSSASSFNLSICLFAYDFRSDEDVVESTLFEPFK